MRWEDLIEALDELETEVEYDRYFCIIREAVIIVTLGSLCEKYLVKNVNTITYKKANSRT